MSGTLRLKTITHTLPRAGGFDEPARPFVPARPEPPLDQQTSSIVNLPATVTVAPLSQVTFDGI